MLWTLRYRSAMIMMMMVMMMMMMMTVTGRQNSSTPSGRTWPPGSPGLVAGLQRQPQLGDHSKSCAGIIYYHLHLPRLDTLCPA